MTAQPVQNLDSAADQFLSAAGYGMDAEPMWGESSEPVDEPISTMMWVNTIVATADPDQRREITGDFVADRSAFIRSLAAKIALHYRLDRNTYYGDVESLVHESLLVLLNDIREGNLPMEDVHSFEGLWQYRTRQAVRRWLDSPEMNAASKQVSLKRRFKEMRQTEQEYLLNHGAQPTPEQVVALTNQRMAETRRDPRRQGVHCTMEDYQSMVAGASVELDAIREVSESDPNEYDGKMHSSEREKMVLLTIERCRKLSETHGQIAEMFFGPSLGAHFDKPPTSTEIADEVGIAAPTVRRKIAEVRKVAQEVLHTYGITGA